ncbi:MAG: hypothetical protein JW745_00395 [Sedimentisphaerales bacterium]|nr:hypothetical protein [Sedimentisphaerales bacterium]MBN2844327.1 hypothetical protein [Sedimentisphaerales bacterium]
MLFTIANILCKTDEQLPTSGILSGIPLQTIILFFMMMVVIFVVLRSTSRRSIAIRDKNAGVTAREMIDRQQRENPNSSISRLQELMAALADMSREINGQLETRAAKLEILLSQADKKIEQYERLLAESRNVDIQARSANNTQGNTGQSGNRNNVKPVTVASVPYTDTTTADMYLSVDSEEPLADEAQEKLVKETTPEIKTESQSENKQENVPESKQQIIELAQSGLPIADISRLTGRPTGEIELILNLSGIKSRK